MNHAPDHMMTPAHGGLLNRFETLFGLRDKPSTHGLQHLESVAFAFSLIPYENLTKIIASHLESNQPARLRMPDTVLADHERWGAGGTCFALTHCLQTILTEYGYACAPRMADLGGQANNHCALVVRHGSSDYLVDPGYLITQPLPLPESGSVIHPTRMYPVRLEKEVNGGAFFLSTLEPVAEKYRYRLHAVNCSTEEFRDYWIDSFSWTMMNSLLITRAVSQGRFYLHDRYMRVFTAEGKHGGKVKSEFDLTVAEQSGIDARLIRQAREILARYKRSLREPGDPGDPDLISQSGG